MPSFDPRWLEWGVTAALLIAVIVYLLRYHIPGLIKAFETGFDRITRALEGINRQQLLVIQRLEVMEDKILEHMASDVKDHGKECRAIANKTEESIKDVSKEMGSIREILSKIV